jgi:uncharacterized membrane protein YhaH (DUF805 family)
MNVVKQWFDPKNPAGRTEFVWIQVAGLILEGHARQWVSAAYGSTRVILTVSLIAMLIVLGISAAKRLLDVGWTRRWSFLILGLILLNIQNGVGRFDTLLLKGAAIFSAVLSIGYFALVIVLFVKSGARRGADPHT